MYLKLAVEDIKFAINLKLPQIDFVDFVSLKNGAQYLSRTKCSLVLMLGEERKFFCSLIFFLFYFWFSFLFIEEEAPNYKGYAVITNYHVTVPRIKITFISYFLFRGKNETGWIRIESNWYTWTIHYLWIWFAKSDKIFV